MIKPKFKLGQRIYYNLQYRVGCQHCGEKKYEMYVGRICSVHAYITHSNEVKVVYRVSCSSREFIEKDLFKTEKEARANQK